MIFITKAEIEDKKSRIIDFATGMTEFDLFEMTHALDEWCVYDA